MYYARNRFYSPALGRFLQRDPNQTGIPIIAALAMNGEAVAILFGGFNGQALYGDGMNLYLFAGSNPVNSHDPLGLWEEYDPFAEVETTMMDIQMDKVAWSEFAYEGMVGFAMGALRSAATIAFTSALTALCPPLGIAVGAAMSAYSAYATVQDIVSYGWTFGRAVSLGLDAFNLGSSSLRAMRLANARLNRARAAYAERGSAAVRGGCFNIIDWKGYPAGVPRPAGPFRLINDAEYAAARAAAKDANRALHRLHPEWAGKPIHEIHPVKFGGSPTDPANKIVLDRGTHEALNAFWRKKQAALR